jgi:tRNA threonylcarbamoyladenosine biosynthesis protein TsaE
MEKEFVTTGAKQTKKLGEMLAKECKGGEIVCLTGDLGSGKTTFAQGFLKGLGAQGPYTSPTFLIMKQYCVAHNAKRIASENTLHASRCALRDAYHFDAYRVGAKDVLELGWEEIIADSQNIVIIEWADRIGDIIPDRAIWIGFEWADENKRKIIFKN